MHCLLLLVKLENVNVLVDIRYSGVSSIPLGCRDWWNFSWIHLKNSQACFNALPRRFAIFRYLLVRLRVYLIKPVSCPPACSYIHKKFFRFLQNLLC